MARYCRLSIEASLFGDVAFVREWGRIGTTCRRIIELHKSHCRTNLAFEAWLQRKQGRGYRITD
ncbi:WGR domain-containing protein [Microvirga sesbaniae]|uniref:WGR domain-containing protein n=1 Tax=Microvirga sesbaniae TaxID=681392 RepID=UPI00358DAA63